MKKLLGLTVAALLVMALVGGGTWAYFSDTESSENNSLAAGTLDLHADGGDDAVNTFSMTEVAPGDTGSGSTTLANAGSLAGEFDVIFSAITNTGGSGGTEYEDGVGHLGGVAKIAVYLDLDQSGTWSSGDIGLKSDGNTYTNPTALDYDVIDSYGANDYDAVQTMAVGAADDFIILWEVPAGAGNNIQGDSVSFDVTFVLEQADAD